jgi:hypothetical protein
MPIGKGEVITASDLNALVTKINNEDTRRGTSSPVLSSATKGDEVAYVLGLDIETIMYGIINLHHCYCEADGGIAQHNGGVNAPDTTPHAIDQGVIEMFRYYDNDIDVMAAQCQCDGFVCTCDGNQSFSPCTCQVNCPCQSQGCSCNNMCDCQSMHCGVDFPCRCDCICECDPFCGCNNGCQCVDQCSCDIDCSCDNDCTCDVDCTCDDVCNCEFGG